MYISAAESSVLNIIIGDDSFNRDDVFINLIFN